MPCSPGGRACAAQPAPGAGLLCWIQERLRARQVRAGGVRGPGATARPRTGQENAAFPGKTHRISCSGSRKHTFPLSPPCHGESLCSAGDNVNSYPGNQGKQGRLFGILREAAARLPHQTGLALGGTAALMATNEPPSLAVGWPLRWKICGSPTEKKNLNLRQTTVCGGGGEERTPSSPSEDGADSCRRPGAGLGSRREPVQCFGRGCPQLCPEECPLGKGCPRGTGLAQEPVSHPAACLGSGLALSSISPGKLQRGLPTALSSCSVYSLLLLPFSSSKNHFIVQTSVTERKRQSYAHTKPRDSVF